MANEDDQRAGLIRSFAAEACGTMVPATTLMLKTPLPDLHRVVVSSLEEIGASEPRCDSDPRILLMATMRWCLAKLEAAPA